MKEIIEKRIVELKSKLGGSPLGSSGLSIGATIARDIEFRKLGYISKWDAEKDTIEELERLAKEGQV